MCRKYTELIFENWTEQIELDKLFYWEFDPGSGWTLAACLIHASHTGSSNTSSGERVSNTWATCPEDEDNSWKRLIILDNKHFRMNLFWKALSSATSGGACGALASWWGNGPPRRWCVAALRGETATLGLRTAQTPTGGSSREFSAMGETLTEQCRVNDEGLRIVKFCCYGRMMRIGNDMHLTVLN